MKQMSQLVSESQSQSQSQSQASSLGLNMKNSQKNIYIYSQHKLVNSYLSHVRILPKHELIVAESMGGKQFFVTFIPLQGTHL